MIKMSIGVDLHKSQFTVCFLGENRAVYETGIYPTTPNGYQRFLKKARAYSEEGYEVKAAVESTGNARFFRNTLLRAGLEVVVYSIASGLFAPSLSNSL